MQKKIRFSFHFRVHSKFGKAKVTKTNARNSIVLRAFLNLKTLDH